MIEIPPRNKLFDEFMSYSVEFKEVDIERTAKKYRKNIEIFLPEDVYDEIIKEAKATNKSFYSILVEKLETRFDSMDMWDEKSKISTKNNRISSINNFFEFLEETGKIERAPHYNLLKVKRNPLTAVSQTEFKKLINSICQKDKYSTLTYCNERDKAIFLLMYHNGITLSEVANLRYEDFIRKNSKIVCMNVHGKHRKRRLAINKETTNALKNYMELYNKAQKAKTLPPLESDTFFKNKRGKRISERSIRRKLEKDASEIGLEIKPSDLRNTYAKTQLCKKSINLKDLAMRMGIQQTRARQLEALIKT